MRVFTTFITIKYTKKDKQSIEEQLRVYTQFTQPECMQQVFRVDLHTPKMLIIQFHTSSVWENACHTIFIQFLKMVENWY